MNELILNLKSIKDLYDRFEDDDFLENQESFLESAVKNFSKFLLDYEEKRHRQPDNDTKGAKYPYGYLGKLNNVLNILKMSYNCSKDKNNKPMLYKVKWEEVIADVEYVINFK